MASHSTNAAGLAEPLTSSVLQFLASHQGVAQVRLDERPPAAAKDILQWEKVSTKRQHSKPSITLRSLNQQIPWHALFPSFASKALNSLILPADLKAFFVLSDGFQLRWSIKMRDELLHLGNLQINTLAQMKRFKVAKLRLIDPATTEDADSEDEDVYQAGSAPFNSSAFPQAFDLDAQCPDGHVALVFHSPRKSAIYFQDLSGRWYFAASTFQAYHRLLLMHLGIPGWQYVFTDAGLTQNTKQWFSFLSPQRLAIDLAHGRSNRKSDVDDVVATIREHSASSTLDLAKIDTLAQSILSLKQQKPVGINSTSSKASNRMDDEE